MNKEFVLVTGEKRSGTTFLANFLNSQDKITLYSDFLRNTSNRICELKLHDFTADLTEQQKNILRSQVLADGYAIGIDDLIWLKNDHFNSVKEMYLKVFELISKNSTVYGFKSTAQYNIIKPFLDCEFKVLFCLRDPRDMLISAKNRFSNFNIFSFAQELESMYAIADAYIKSPNYRIVKYEDFILNKEIEIKKLSSFLNTGINIDVNLIHRNNLKFVSNSSFQNVNKIFDPSSISRWKNDPLNKDILLIDLLFRKKLEQFNYEQNAFANEKSAQDILKEYSGYKQKIRIKNFIRSKINKWLK